MTRLQGNVCRGFATVKAPLAPPATHFVRVCCPRSTSYTARRAYTAVVRAMESSKVRTALEETSNDGAFKVGTVYTLLDALADSTLSCVSFCRGNATRSECLPVLFQRKDSQFRNFIKAGGRFPPEGKCFCLALAAVGKLISSILQKLLCSIMHVLTQR